jgi:hypothetical protein
LEDLQEVAALRDLTVAKTRTAVRAELRQVEVDSEAPVEAAEADEAVDLVAVEDAMAEAVLQVAGAVAGEGRDRVAAMHQHLLAIAPDEPNSRSRGRRFILSATRL